MYCVAFTPTLGGKAYRFRSEIPEYPVNSESVREEQAWIDFERILFGSKSNGTLVLYRYYPGRLTHRITRTAKGKKRRKRNPQAKSAWVSILAQASLVGR